MYGFSPESQAGMRRTLRAILIGLVASEFRQESKVHRQEHVENHAIERVRQEKSAREYE